MAKSQRGFAAMSPEQQRAIASAGGRAAHQSGNAHEFTSEEARAAGRKGGAARHHSKAASKTQAAPQQQRQSPQSQERNLDEAEQNQVIPLEHIRSASEFDAEAGGPDNTEVPANLDEADPDSIDRDAPESGDAWNEHSRSQASHRPDDVH